MPVILITLRPRDLLGLPRIKTGRGDVSGENRLPATSDFGSRLCVWSLGKRVDSERRRNRNSSGHTWARFERHLPLPMTVNQCFVLLSIIEKVTRRRLCDGVSADSPSRDVKLSTSPPCRLLDRSQGQSRKKHSGLTSAYLRQPVHQPVITERQFSNEYLENGTDGENVPIILREGGKPTGVSSDLGDQPPKLQATHLPDSPPGKSALSGRRLFWGIRR